MKIEIDKLLHFLVGYSIVVTFVALGYSGTGLFLALCAGCVKEVYDYFNKDSHTPDYKDAIATFIGAGLGMLLTFIKI